MPTQHRPLTAAQRTIWFDQTLSTDGAVHTMGDHLDLCGPLDRPVLLRALAQLVREAEVMRVRFVEVDGMPRQVVDPDLTVGLDVVDLRRHGPDAVDVAVTAMRADLDREFSLTAAPLARGTLYVVDDERHLCYLAMHHVLCDGYSRVPLYDRLATIYRALAAGQDSTAGALPGLDVLLDAEQSYLASSAHERDRAYWTAAAPGFSELFTLSSRPGAPGRAQLRHSVVLRGETARAVRAGASACGTTWATFAIAATAAYLGKAAGADAVQLTLPVTGRVGGRARRVPGMVANYLPLRAQVGPGVRRGELLAAVSHAVLSAVRHQRFRGEQVRRLAGLDGTDRRPFGPYVNILPQAPVLDLGPVRAELVNLSTGVVDDLMVTVLDGPDDAVELHVNGNPARYDDDELRAHARRLADFVTRFAGCRQDTPLGQLAVTDADDARALRVGVGPVVDEPYVGVVEQVRAQAAATPQAVAVVDDGGQVSYADLVLRADRVAAAAAGCRRGAILAEPGRDFVTAVLGLLGAGAAFVPLDVRAPDTRTAGLLGDCGAELLLVDRTGRDLATAVVAEAAARGQQVRVVEIGAVATPPDASVSPLAPVQGGPRDVAYVLFTSGTTGRPKGAMVHRDGLVNHLACKLDVLPLSATDTVVQNAPVTFDVSIWQMLAPLVAGARVWVVSPSTAADPDALAALVPTECVTVLEVVPSLLRAALDLWGADGGPDLSGLRLLMVTGEALPVDLCTRWTTRHPDIPLVNAYGPTECSDDVAHAVITAGTVLDRRAPIGLPIRNTQLWVLGPDLQPPPLGAVGELYVAGRCVGQGYLDDPARTALTFVADPAGPPGSRMYRTGDRVRWSEQGQLEFVERLDHQVKIRGQRIELGEIEAHLAAAPEVSGAVVVARKDGRGLAHLSAYLTGPEGLDLDAVRSRLADRLPEPMVPTRWALLAALPLTAHGKVDRKALPELPPAAAQGSAQRAAQGSAPAPQPGAAGPATGTGEDGDLVATLRETFARVLGRDEVGPDEHFIGLGGDSIGAIQVVGLLRRRDVPATPRDVFELGTPRAVARALAGRALPGQVRTAGASSDMRSLDHGPVDVEPTPIAVQLAGDVGTLRGPAACYSQHTVLRVPTDLALDDVHELLTAVVAAHSMLRARFTEHASGVWSAQIPATPDDGAERVAGQVSQVAAGSDLAQVIGAAAARLEPGAGVVWQAVLVGGAPHRLVLVLHHLVVDGVSWRVLREDLAQAWSSRRSTGTAVVPAEPVTFARWARAQGALARSGAWVDVELVRWRLQGTDGVSRFEDQAPRLDARRDVWGTAGRLTVELGTDVAGALLAQCPGRYRAEVNDLMLGALATALSAADLPWSALPAARQVEVEGHGREEVTLAGEVLDVSRTVGWFTSTFPVALPESSGCPQTSLLSAVKQVHQRLRSLPRHGVGYGMLRHQHPQGRELLGPQVVPPLGFNYLGRVDGPAGDWQLESGAVTGAGSDAVIGTVTHPAMPLRHLVSLTASTQERADGPHLVAEWVWAPALVGEDAVRRLADGWFAALTELVATSDRPGNRAPVPADVPLVPVDDADLARFTDRDPARPVVDVLPVSAAQRGMLLHNQIDDEHPDPYVLQVCADLVGELDADRLATALDDLLAVHPALGAEFGYTSAGTPVQVLREPGHLVLERHDSPTSEGGLAQELADQDRARRFNLSAGPAIRSRLVRISDHRHRFVLTLHHILVDGWSMPLVVDELLGCYARRGRPQAPRPHLRRYAQWVAEQDEAAGQRQLRSVLAGLPAPTLLVPALAAAAGRVAAGPTASTLERAGAELVVHPVADDDQPTRSRLVLLDAGHSARLAARARTDRVTTNTLVQVAWGAMLAETTGHPDTLFGATVSTRPEELAEAQELIGMFLTTLPVRVHARPGESSAQLTARVQQQQVGLRTHGHVSLGVALAEHPTLRGLGEPFDTTVVFENFPTGDDFAGRSTAGLTIENATTWDARHHPLSLVVLPGDQLGLRFDHRPDLLDDDAVERLSQIFLTALDDLVDGRVPPALRPVVPGAVIAPEVAAAPAYREPETAAEAAIAAAFAQVLGHPRVGADDNFFLLGGDSIAAIHVVGALREQGLDVAPRDLFTHRTPARLAGHSARSDRPAAGPTVPQPPTLTDAELDDLAAELGF